MKYILMMNTMKAGHGVPEWPKNDLQAHIAFTMSIVKELRESGELASAEGLAFPDQAKGACRASFEFKVTRMLPCFRPAA